MGDNVMDICCLWLYLGKNAFKLKQGLTLCLSDVSSFASLKRLVV